VRLFGLDIRVRKSADDVAHWTEESGGWWPIIREGYAGAWQQNISIRRETLLAFTPVYACMTRIATDVGKMPMQLVEQTFDEIWVKVKRYSPLGAVVRKPNDYQSQSQFLQQWMISKLLAGNAYILKQRDNRGVVVKLFPLDPTRVRPLITPDGSIYYNLGIDPLSELLDATTVAPSSEIIHDRMPGLFHPLIGTSPIFACSLPAAQGHAMQRSSAAFFKNMAQPSGVLTAPGAISDETADRLKKEWTEKFAGKNVGRVAILGDGLKFDPITVTAQAAQVTEQLRLTGEQVCTAFNVPAFMVGVAPVPVIPGIEALTQLYWSQCLQTHMEGIESGMTEGLGLYDTTADLEVAVRLDLSVLLRMDTSTRYTAWKAAISGGWLAPNEARKRENLKPVKGGDTPYMQQQNYSLAALAARDAAGPPSSGPTPPALSAPGAIADDGTDNASSADGDGQGSENDAVDAELDYAKGVAILRQRLLEMTQ
jgi:HK97 family phage portal protein